MKTPSKKIQIGAALIALVLLAVLIYWRALGFSYVWDDWLIYLNRYKLLYHPLSWSALSASVLSEASYFRPMIFLTFWLEYHLFGPNAEVSHCINIVFFIVNSLLLFLIVKKLAGLCGRKNPVLIAFVAALLYVAHPALVESTVWVSGRFDIMATMFFLAGVLAFLGNTPKFIKALLVAACMLASLFSKEIGIMFPAIVFCLWFGTQGKIGNEGFLKTLLRCVKENKAIWCAIVVGLVIYFALRFESLPQTFYGKMNWEYVKTAYFQQLLPFNALRFYLLHAFFPFYKIAPQNPQALFVDSWGALTLFANVACVALVVAIFYFSVKKHSLSGWLFIAGLACLLPVLKFFPLTIGGNIGHDRFLTLPLAFWVMSLALIDYEGIFEKVCEKKWALPENFKSFKTFLLAACGCWLVAGFLTTLSYVPVWKNGLTLWGYTRFIYPDSYAAKTNFWMAALQAHRLDLIEKEAEQLRKETQGKGMSVQWQMLYVYYLVARNDPEAFNYALGVDSFFAKFPRVSSNPEDSLRPLSFRPGQLYYFYSVFSGIALMYKGDPQMALHLSDVAKWFVGEETVPTMYQKIAYNEALGNFEKAKQLENRVSHMFPKTQDVNKRWVKYVLAQYCVTKKMSGVCPKLLEEGMISQEQMDKLKKNAELYKTQFQNLY